MLNKLIEKIGTRPSLKLCMLMFLLSMPAYLSAQTVMIGAQTGTVQELRQDDGYVIISSRRVGFDNEIVQIYLNNEPVGGEILDEGMVVRYTLDNRGNLERVEILGPNNKLRDLDEN